MAGRIGQTFVVRSIVARDSSFAITTTTDGEATIARTKVSIGVRRGVPEQGEGVREIVSKREGVDTCIGLSCWADGTDQPTRTDDDAIGEDKLPVVVGSAATDHLVQVYLSLSRQHNTGYSRLSCQVCQQCQRL